MDDEDDIERAYAEELQMQRELQAMAEAQQMAGKRHDIATPTHTAKHNR